MKTLMSKRSRPSIGKPAMCHARKERVLLIGTDQRITSGPAARTAASRGRIHGCTRIVSRKGQILFPCTAGAVHTWHIASSQRAAEFGHYRGIAAVDQAAPIKLDYGYAPLIIAHSA